MARALSAFGLVALHLAWVFFNFGQGIVYFSLGWPTFGYGVVYFWLVAVHLAGVFFNFG